MLRIVDMITEDYFFKQQAIIGKVSDFKPFDIVKVNNELYDRLWNYMVHTWHYLGCPKMVGPRIKYLVFLKGMPIAAISFNQAALRVGARDKWIGLDHENILKILPFILNNNRFLILPWVRIKNFASHILSKSLQLLKTDWPKLYNVIPHAVETFVDFSNYRGTCYKAANWKYIGETSGFGKAGKTFVYHGNKKGIFIYILNRKFHQLISQFPPKKPKPKPDNKKVRTANMLLSIPDWSSDLFEEINLNRESVESLGKELDSFLASFSSCYSRSEQQNNGELYVKGLLSDLNRKSIERIALKYRDEKAVRPLQLYLKQARWDDEQMKASYQRRIFRTANDPDGMMTVDGSDHPKKGNRSAGVKRQYCGNLGKVENCQAGVYIGYSGRKGYGLLDAGLYLPETWFDDQHKALWDKCDIPENTIFKTKPQIASDLIQQAVKKNEFKFKWIGCDASFGCDSEFRKSLPESTYFFADVRSTYRVFKERPKWEIQECKGKGEKSSKLIPSVQPVPVSRIAEDDTIPWKNVIYKTGAKGPVTTKVKCCRIIEIQDGKDTEELWLYIREHENGKIKYSVSNAPADIDEKELHHAAELRWPIEQSFEECKGYLGMSDYETRSYIAWHRHMLLVMLAHLFLLEVRHKFKKKRQNCTDNATSNDACNSNTSSKTGSYRKSSY
jgi:SRSO17 transposase